MTNPWVVLLLVPMVKIVVIMGVVILSTAYLSYYERRLVGFLQIRLGPNRVGWQGVLQPIADALKLFSKEDIIPTRAEKLVYLSGPVLIIVPALVVFSVIPFGPPTNLFGLLPQAIPPYLTDINISVLFVLGVSSFGIYGIILGGWASNNKFSLMGGLRSAAQLISYEVPMGFAIVAVLLMAGSLSLVSIVEAQRQAHVWYVFPGFVAFFIYFICGVAETNRNPFDLPEAEAELVAGFHTEYSGMKFAFYFLAEYANMIVISSMATVLFFGGWLRPFPSWGWLGFLDVIPPFVWFLAKVMVFLSCYIWFRGTFPRVRFDQLMALGWKVFLPVSLANVMVIGTLIVLFGGCAMSVRTLLTEIFHLDLLGGLWQTARFTMSRKATVPYPEKRLDPTPRFRGMFGFSEERCIVCRACERACPIKIIYIDGHLEEVEVDGKKRKKQVLDRYDIDVKRCMFCGLCQEACPTKPEAIWLTSRTYELATYERDLSLYFRKDRLQSWEGVLAYPGVVSPAEGQTPDDPGGKGGKEQG